MSNKIGIIIQARMGSSRLPSKIMMPIKNMPVFEYQLNRLSNIGYQIFIATTTKPADDKVAEFATQHRLQYYRGSEDNVLSRYYHCAAQYNLETIIRLTSDCPFIDASIVSEGIAQYIKAGDDQVYLSNTLDRTYPRGADFEVFSFKMLKNAFDNATQAFEKEHVTPYMWKNPNSKFKIVQQKQADNYSYFRLTLDTPEDFKLIKILIETYDAENLTMAQICNVLEQHSELPLINAHIEQKKV